MEAKAVKKNASCHINFDCNFYVATLLSVSLIPLLLFVIYDYAFCARRQKAVTVDPMVFACVAMMSRAIGPKISKEVKDLLEPMLSVGLR